MIPIDLCVMGNSTGNFLIDACCAWNFNMEAGMTARKGPVSANLVRMLMASA
jgi:hypothetical protein